MAKLYVQTTPPPDLNKNTEWFMYPGVWTTYILILFFSWLMVLSVFGCTPGMAWTIVNLSHFMGLPFQVPKTLEERMPYHLIGWACMGGMVAGELVIHAIILVMWNTGPNQVLILI
ncbi:hypothetical protein Taro_051525 [Colocasia esculenta]|uniref:Uncharacterized protein n=1 Tax=Colocasia esculenta TaxID=4460 RepID=A0A843XH44_COLES|nr:hypothetical protein [Colocasia esculenta]